MLHDALRLPCRSAWRGSQGAEIWCMASSERGTGVAMVIGMDHKTLHDVVRQKIADGRLPRSQPFRSLKARGIGAACAVCDGVISARQHELELLCMDSSRRTDALRFHLPCLEAWRTARNAAA